MNTAMTAINSYTLLDFMDEILDRETGCDSDLLRSQRILRSDGSCFDGIGGEVPLGGEHFPEAHTFFEHSYSSRISSARSDDGLEI